MSQENLTLTSQSACNDSDYNSSVISFTSAADSNAHLSEADEVLDNR